MNEIFPSIYRVFVVLGTIVGVVVITYMIYNAYKYRAGAEHELDIDRPQLGELPEDEGGGRKLAISLSLSALIVIGLIGWTYIALQDVEGGVPDPSEDINVRVEGFRFGWQFIYPNGHTSTTLRVPEGRPVTLNVTSRDVIHNFGIPEFNIKTDAIPGQTTDIYFVAPETGNYTAQCFELCGTGHSQMEAKVVVMEPEEYDKWYASTGSEDSSNAMSSQKNSSNAMSSQKNSSNAMSSQKNSSNAMSSQKNSSNAMSSQKNSSSDVGSSNSYSIENTLKMKSNDRRPA
jgi:cytochrome c oxidase subunit 2